MEKREKIWDIVKGIGIISVVIGHVIPNETIHEFVYMYNLAIFYFISAFFYNEKKWGDNPFGNFGKRVKSIWPKYMFYSIIIALLHNFLIKYNFYRPDTKMYYEFKDYIVPIFEAATFNNDFEIFLGALWFIPTIIAAVSMLGGIVYLSRKIATIIFPKLKQFIKNEKYIKYYLIIIFTVLLSIIGVIMNYNVINLHYRTQVAFLVIPICTMGYFFREFLLEIKKIAKIHVIIPIFVISTALLLFIELKTQTRIAIGTINIMNPYIFYLVSFLGICFCISFAKIIEKIPLVNRLFELCGKNSFSIMALHFVSIKGVDVIYSKLINETDPIVISKFVSSYPNRIWLVYVFAGCLVPLVFSIIINYIKKILKNYNRNNEGEIMKGIKNG